MGTLFVAATPIGNLNDVSKRLLDILKNVDLIAAEDTRQTIKLLNHFDIKTKMTAYHKFNEKNKSNFIIEELINGKNIALVSDAGTPCISDPGYILVKEAREKNINVIGIPGPSAVITALSISGMDTTNFTFIGFLPNDNKKFKEELEKIEASEFKTFILYESPKRLVKLVDKLKSHFPKSKIFIASDLTKVHERSFFGPIEEVYNIIKQDPNIEKGEYALILEKESTKKVEIVSNNSIESLLIDTIVKEKCTLREAIKFLTDTNKTLKKNEVYEASINLKKIMENIL